MKNIIIAEFNSYYCNELVNLCMKNGIPIQSIIYVGDKPNSDSLRIHWEYTNFHQGLSIAELEQYKIPVYFVKNINKKNSLDLISDLQPDLILQGGCGIIKKDLMSRPTIGILNSHPGILPKYRGCMAVEWAIHNDDPLGATCHFIDEGIDTGPIVLANEMEVQRGMTYWEIRTKMFYHQVNTMLLGIQKIKEGVRWDTAEIQHDGEYNKPMGKENLERVINKINNNEYKYL